MFFCFQDLNKTLGDSFAKVPQPYHGSIMKSRSIQNYPRPIPKNCALDAYHDFEFERLEVDM